MAKKTEAEEVQLGKEALDWFEMVQDEMDQRNERAPGTAVVMAVLLVGERIVDQLAEIHEEVKQLGSSILTAAER
jgi:hypothetical protein